MSNSYDTARNIYMNMDIENLPNEQPMKESGLLTRKPTIEGIDYKNPLVRVAKQLEVIRNFRNGEANDA